MGRAKPVWIVLIATLLCGVASATTINSVTFAKSTMTISGIGFSGVLVVTLNAQDLTIVSSTPTQIVATLPTLPDTGTYRLVVKAGKASTFAYVTTPSPTLLTGGCYSANFGVGDYATIWLIGDGGEYQGCQYGSHYPPYYGLPLASGGVLRNLTVTGTFIGTATVYVNYLPTALSCTHTTQDASGCSDLADRIQVNAGDFLDVGITPTVGGQYGIQATVQFQEQ